MLSRCRKILWLPLGALVLTLASCSPGSKNPSVALGGTSSSTSFTTTGAPRSPSSVSAANELAAGQEAARLLKAVRLPGAIRQITHPPLPQLAAPDSGAAFCPTFVDVHRFWIAKGRLSQVADTITRHPPKSLQKVTSSGTPYSSRGEFLQFLSKSPSGLPDVNFVLLQMGHQHVGIRADAIVVPAGVACPRSGPTKAASA